MVLGLMYVNNKVPKLVKGTYKKIRLDVIFHQKAIKAEKDNENRELVLMCQPIRCPTS